MNSASYCLSCVSDFTKKGWKCLSNSYIQFNVVLSKTGVSDSQILLDIDTIINQILIIIGEDTNNIQTVSIEQVIHSSLQITGTAAPSSASLSTASSSLSTSLAGPTLAGYDITGSSVIVYSSSS